VCKPSEAFYIRRVENALDLPLPAYMSDGAAGMDLRANIYGELILQPSEIKSVPVGIQIALPIGWEAQIRPRSGLALRGVTLVNAPGTVDADYRGEIKVILINLGQENFILTRGDRIAQMVINQIIRAPFEEVDTLSQTERGLGGFGHTGLE
jgi:dUTP pyrophosphatase